MTKLSLDTKFQMNQLSQLKQAVAFFKIEFVDSPLLHLFEIITLNQKAEKYIHTTHKGPSLYSAK